MIKTNPRLAFRALLLHFMISTSVSVGFAQQTETLTAIVDLETKVTEKVKTIINPIDPDAIVYTKVTVKSIDTDLVGTQMATTGFLATSDIKKIDDADIQSIEVSVLSSKPAFPKEVAKLVEAAVLNISKKGRVKITQMEDETVKAIQTNKEHTRIQSENFQKLGQAAGEFYSLLIYAGVGLLFSFGLIQFLLAAWARKSQAQAVQHLAEKLAEMKPAQNDLPELGQMPARWAQQALPEPAAPQSITSRGMDFGGQVSVFENLSTTSLVSLISDAYWSQKDSYASWMWSHLSPNLRTKLLEAWPPLHTYVRHLANVPGHEDNFHFDSYYLKPADISHLSNEDLLSYVRTNPKAWGSVSMMRRKSVGLSLKERVDFAKFANETGPVAWPDTKSAHRIFQAQMEVSRLTLEDEQMILDNPDFVPEHARSSLPSLVWLSLLNKENKEKLLQKYPAQFLAEVWVGPESLLSDLMSTMPEKKQALLKDYIQRVQPNRNSPSLKKISIEGLALLKEQASVQEPRAA